MKRTALAVLLAIILPVVTATTAVASGNLSLSSTSLRPGDTLYITGTGFPATATVNLTSSLTACSRSITTQSNGSFTVGCVIPQDTPTNTYSITASASNGTTQASFQVVLPQVTLSPNPVIAGQNETVAGTGFLPNQGLTVQVVFSQVAPSPPTSIIIPTSSNSSGAFSTTFTVPGGTIPNTYSVQVTQSNTTVTRPLTVVPGNATITITPSSIGAGPSSQVQVAGTGFGSNETIRIQYTANLIGGGTAVEQTSTISNGSGSFTVSNLAVPANVAPGAYSVTASGQNSGRAASANLVVTTTQLLTLSPTAGAPGAVISASGQHFAPNTAVTVTASFPQSNGVNSIITVASTADSNGAFTVPLTIPARSVPGAVPVTASQIVNITVVSASAQLTVVPLQPSLKVAPATVLASTAVTISGRGFLPGPGAPVQVTAPITVNGVQQTIGQTVDTDASGSFTVILTVPAGAAGGAYTVTATQSSSGVQANAIIEVSASTPTPTNTPTPTPTATSTPVPTIPPPPAVRPLKFRYVLLSRHNVRRGETSHIDIQSTVSGQYGVKAHVIFPSGVHLDWNTKTNLQGRWQRTFRVPGNALSRYSNIAHLEIQLLAPRTGVKTFLAFTILR